MNSSIPIVFSGFAGRTTMPFYLGAVQAGYPTPVSGYLHTEIDFNDMLVTHRNSTFTVQVSGDSMVEAHIPDGAMLIVDRVIAPYNGAIILALVDGEYTVKYYERSMKGIRLIPANKKYSPIQITEFMNFEVWGVVTRVILRVDR